jgi:hypothetical protein
VCHQRMGIDSIGGSIQGIDPNVIAEDHGLYRADERTLDIVVALGIAVSQQDMRIACGLRLNHRLTQLKFERIDKIAYVFATKRIRRNTFTSSGSASSSAGTSTSAGSIGWIPTTTPRRIHRPGSGRSSPEEVVEGPPGIGSLTHWAPSAARASQSSGRE